MDPLWDRSIRCIIFRAKVIDFTEPYRTDPVCFMYKKPPPAPQVQLKIYKLLYNFLKDAPNN